MELRALPDGIELWVHVRPRSHRTTVGGEHDGALCVSVLAAPTDGRANAAVCAAIAEALGLRSREVELLAGGKSRRKRLKALGEAGALARRVLALLRSGPV